MRMRLKYKRSELEIRLPICKVLFLDERIQSWSEPWHQMTCLLRNRNSERLSQVGEEKLFVFDFVVCF